MAARMCLWYTPGFAFVPPIGVFMISGCGADLLINILLTILGYFPGHIHAFYLEYVYYDRRRMTAEGRFSARPAPGVYSDRIQNGGHHHNAPPAAPAGNNYGTTYGTVPAA
ncbi:hypothetical protein PVAR5_5518 [Paecilomyces variotii No. 5]|uniref:Stress response RCI peptide n=1 Tax=Byssochlamys spectabilis (strain No. 5 / NBRC 109023) TaxID=1356009 RepID=V5FXN5_BYSSN|nr:hypothetical protein PVAR5_5518 [Paecilomyces variotii No. 5]